MLVYQTSPLKVEPFSSVKTFFCCNKFATGHVSGNALYSYFEKGRPKNVHATILEDNMGY